MKLGAFQTLRSGLQMNAVPVTSQVRALLETGLREELTASGLFEEVEVEGSDDPDRLVLGLCVFRGEVSEEEVMVAVERAWTALAFHHWSAHAFLTDEGHVELQAATLDRPGGRFASVHLVALRAAEAAGAATGEAAETARQLVSAA
jgi:hypothetical protein